MATNAIPTAQEIQRRVEEADTTRQQLRAAAAQQVGELAAERAIHAGKLQELERRLGDVIAGSGEVMEIDELSRFTNIPPLELRAWLATSKPARTRRRTTTTGTQRDTSREGPSTGTTAAQANASLDTGDARRPTHGGP
ncbi:hypothetical protein [Lentzea sp. HUAS12]|uniref:hypothetical protein n=1 Tax=Lentzea sp. HUAS12 TaxID=2951806 RepID=UPI00209D2002|nr:hypothetical protein [Lentzea sp. HUAS12]USX56426.1 hypothetical protein ND450_20685 [Lentzea sp. HUAS12]